MKAYYRVLTTALLVSTLGGCSPSIGSVVIENAGASTADVRLEVGENHYMIRGIDPNERRVVWYPVPPQDSAYFVSATFESGATVARKVGYLSIDMTPDDGIAVSETGVGFAAGHRVPDGPVSPLTSTSPL